MMVDQTQYLVYAPLHVCMYVYGWMHNSYGCTMYRCAVYVIVLYGCVGFNF